MRAVTCYGYERLAFAGYESIYSGYSPCLVYLSKEAYLI